MTKANESAFPTQRLSNTLPQDWIFQCGLTKRELFAVILMHACLNTPVEELDESEIFKKTGEVVAGRAVVWADALLKELEREAK